MIWMMIASAAGVLALSAILGPWDWIIGFVLEISIVGLCLDALMGAEEVQRQE